MRGGSLEPSQVFPGIDEIGPFAERLAEVGGRLIDPPEFPEGYPEEVVRARIRPLAQDHLQVEPSLLEPGKVELGHTALKSALRIPRGSPTNRYVSAQSSQVRGM